MVTKSGAWRDALDMARQKRPHMGRKPALVATAKRLRSYIFHGVIVGAEVEWECEHEHGSVEEAGECATGEMANRLRAEMHAVA